MPPQKWFAFALLSCFLIARPALSADAPKYPFLDVKLPIEKRVADLVSRMTLDEKISQLHSTADPIPRLGIGSFAYGNEALHGVATGKFTVFPMPIALSATWDVDLVKTLAVAISDEAWGAVNRDTAKGGYPGEFYHTFWCPTINMARDPRWGRTAEAYGEDPWLTARFTAAFVKGVQGDDPKYIKVAATPKHFAANNEDHNRDYCNARISETALREYYLPGFQAAVMEGRAQSIMGAYNAINGVPCNANRWLMVDVLRKDWGFDGYTVTDCGAPHLMFAKHGYVKNAVEAAAATLNAGVAVECGGDDILRKNMKEAMKQGLVTPETLDRAITEAFTVRFRIGMFDPPEMNPYTKIPATIIGSPEHMELARRESRESIVLLKNTPVNGASLLPLDAKKIKSVAVIGRNAAVLQFGDYTGSPANTPVSPLDGIRNRLGPNVAVNNIDWIPAPDDKRYETVPAAGLRVADGQRGLKAEYFAGADFSGAPALSRTETAVNFKSAESPVGADGAVSVRWTGKLVPTASGAHYFYVNTGSEARLYIDGELVLEKLTLKKKKTMRTGRVLDAYQAEQPEIRKAATAMLEAGKSYDIKIEFATAKSGAYARLEWVPPSAAEAAARVAEMKAIRESDAVVAVVGLQLQDERETIDRHDLDISNDQTEYVKQALKFNPNTVVVLINGGSLSINRLAQNAPAILEAWYPGEQGGNAIADALFGDYNPAGRLTMTYYKSVDDLPAFDDYEVSRGRTYMYFAGDPLYPFGYGLSYTTFQYGALALSGKTAHVADKIDVSFTVKNTGDRDGDEVVQMYVRDLNPAVKRPLKRLRGFQRVHLKKGESRNVALSLAVKDLAYWDDKKKTFAVEPGGVEIQIGASSADIRLKDTVEITGE